MLLYVISVNTTTTTTHDFERGSSQFLMKKLFNELFSIMKAHNRQTKRGKPFQHKISWNIIEKSYQSFKIKKVFDHFLMKLPSLINGSVVDMIRKNVVSTLFCISWCLDATPRSVVFTKTSLLIMP